jgi:hypothetical protein
MSGFKQTGLVISEKATPVAPSNPGEITVVARDGKLYKFDGVTETEIGAGDLSAYTLLTTTAEISGNLQSQIDAITVPTSGTFVADYDNRYVNVTGDTMTGTLAMNGAGIQLDINHTPAHSEGTIFYDSQFKTLSYYNDNPDVTINIGQESVVRVRNNTGSLIANGKVVCISGSTGNHPLIVLADNTNPGLSHNTLGVATHNISNNEDGYVTTSGMVNGINTSMFSNEGVTLWLDTSGGLTETEPTALIHKVKIGYLVRKHINQGRILVEIDTGMDLKDLHDVSIGDYEDGALLVANGAVWQPGANVNDLATKTEVASISAGLDSRINSISTSTSTGVSGIHGTSLVELSQNNVVVNHSNISGDPIVSLTIPNSGSIVYVCGITEVNSSSFKVVLSDSVPSTGYKISWFRGGVSSTSTNSLTVDTNFLVRTFSASESYTIPDGINKLICLGGSLSGITITMPANPTNGQILLISRFGLPSAFTLNANIGQTLQLGGSTASGPGYYNRSYLYSSSTLTWYLIGE